MAAGNTSRGRLHSISIFTELRVRLERRLSAVNLKEPHKLFISKGGGIHMQVAIIGRVNLKDLRYLRGTIRGTAPGISISLKCNNR